MKKNMKEKTKKGKNVTSTKNKKKKDSKGFTLIEIIGVIIIIGIIMIIGTVAVSGYIESSKARTYESYKKDLEGATENLMVECISGNEEGCDIPEYGRDIKISYNELVEKGYSDRLKDPEGEGYCDTSYVIAKNNSENGVELEYQVCLYCSNYKSEEAGCEELGGSDSVPPTCDYTQLVGASTEWTKENKVISIGCSDGESGCQNRIFSNSIGKEGEVIEKGTITIRDNAGNERECEVDAYVDKSEPSCRVEIEGTGVNGWYSPGTKVKLVSTSDEGSGVAEYGMGSSLINKDYNGKEEYEVRNGIVTVFGYVKDEVGNEGYCSVEVRIDDATPEGEVNMGYEIYPKEDSTKSGTRLTINNIEKYGEVKGVIIYFNKNVTGSYTSYVYDETDKNIKTGGGIVSGRDRAIIEIEEGEYEELAIYIGSSSVISSIEKVEVLKEETVTSVWTNKDVSVYIKAEDRITGIEGYSYNNGVSYQEEEIKSYSGNTSGVIRIRDKVGNVSDGISFTINKIDKTDPSCTLKASGTQGNNGWYKGTVTISIASSSDNGSVKSGVDVAGVGSYTNGATRTLSSDTTGSSYTGYVRDNAGNTATCRITVKRDNTAPYTPALDIDRMWQLYNTTNGQDYQTIYNLYCELENGTKIYPTAKGGQGSSALYNKRENITCYEFKIWDGQGTYSVSHYTNADSISGINWDTSKHRFGGGTYDASKNHHSWGLSSQADVHGSGTHGSNDSRYSGCTGYNIGLTQYYATDSAGNQTDHLLSIYSISSTEANIKNTTKAENCIKNSNYYFGSSAYCKGSACLTYQLP